MEFFNPHDCFHASWLALILQVQFSKADCYNSRVVFAEFFSSTNLVFVTESSHEETMDLVLKDRRCS